MLFVKLSLVSLVFISSGRCQEGGNYSSLSPKPPSDTRRMTEEQAAALRRQLMRDNYDYTHSDNERKHPNVSVKSDDTANVYYEKGAHYLPASGVAETDSDAYSAEHEQNEQSSQLEQDVQYEQPGEHKHFGQYELTSQYVNDSQRKQYRQEEQRDQYDTRANGAGRGRSQREQPGQQEQYDEREQAQYEEQTDRARPSYADADELTTRDIIESKYTSDRRDSDLARRHIEPQRTRALAYNPSYQNKQLEAYNPYRREEQQARPFGDLRGDFKEQYLQNDAAGQPEQKAQAENEEYNQEELEAIDQQNMSDSQDDDRSDYSGSKKQPLEIYNEFGHTTRVKRLQYYTTSSAARASPNRGRNSLSYQDHYAPSGRHHHAPLGRNHYALSGRYRNSPRSRNYYEPPSRNHREPPGHHHYRPPQRNHKPSLEDNIYMDGTQLRRHNNEMSSDVHGEEELPPPQPSASPSSSRASPTSSRANPASTKPPNLSNTQRARKSFVVTVAPGNVTYKLLTLKTREGRRRGERRFLQERRPGGVAIISLDHAPLPPFRLPRARRQYMHDHHHHRQ